MRRCRGRTANGGCDPPGARRREGALAIDRDLARTVFTILASVAAQIRKDISQFGEFGKQGTGYSIPYLLDKLREILGEESR